MSTAASETGHRHEPAGATRKPHRAALATAAVLVVVVIGAVIALRLVFAGSDAGATEQIPTTPVRRGNLTVSVTEGGALRAMESLEVKSEVEGSNVILEIVDEGTIITDEDVRSGKVLAQLDVSNQREQLTTREINVRNAEASYVQAQEGYAIQVKQNESNVANSELNVKFGRMELEQYLGSSLAEQLLAGNFDFAALGAHAKAEIAGILGPESANDAVPASSAVGPEVTESLLGGTARQRLRDLGSNVQLAERELRQAQEQLTYSRQLFDRQYISRNELAGDELDEQRQDVALEAAKEELRLFIRYTLAKDAEERYSDYKEALRELDRVGAKAQSELAQAEANLESRKATLDLEQSRLDKTRTMIEKATIHATKPGVVVYATTSDPWRRNNNPIQEGASVRENETLLTVPDLRTLAARVSVHETEIAKVRPGQKAWVTVEAISGSHYPAHVAKVSPMASSENRWLNPDVMVYDTDVSLDSPVEGLTVGMSASAQMIIAELNNVLYVPVEAVTTYGGRRMCWVKTPDGPQIRFVRIGQMTDKYVEITDGLTEGEQVYLAPPQSLDELGPAPATEENAEQAAPEGAPATAPTGAPAGQQPSAGQQPPVGQQPPAGQQPAAEQQPPAADQQQTAAVDVEALIKRVENLEPTQMGEFFQNLTPQERAAMRNLTEEQRQKLFSRFQPPGGGQGGGPGAWQGRGQGGAEGGAPGGQGRGPGGGARPQGGAQQPGGPNP